MNNVEMITLTTLVLIVIVSVFFFCKTAERENEPSISFETCFFTLDNDKYMYVNILAKYVFFASFR